MILKSTLPAGSEEFVLFHFTLTTKTYPQPVQNWQKLWKGRENGEGLIPFSFGGEEIGKGREKGGRKIR